MACRAMARRVLTWWCARGEAEGARRRVARARAGGPVKYLPLGRSMAKKKWEDGVYFMAQDRCMADTARPNRAV